MTEEPMAHPGPETVRPGPKSLLVLAGIGGLLVLLGALAGYLLLARSGTEPTVEVDGGSGDQVVDDGGGGLDTVDLAAALDIADSAGLGDPVTVELPAIDDGVARWLGADGQQMVPFTESVVPLWSEGDEACGQVVNSLAQIGEPAEIEAVALSAPDPVAADVFGGLYRTVARALLACGRDTGGEEFETRRTELAWQWALATRVIDASGGA
ncbi:MAG: hypothetical protein GY724_25910 [Actinomycetia bacterium]|nr:hypothetical protein [Actinomycetes bacterium]MCP5032640.1 hypothetical protein [Actinomycetes bacterium]